MPAGGFKPHERVPEGESGMEVRARAERMWSRLMSTHAECARIVVISHGMLISTLFRVFLSLPMDSDVGISTADTGIHLWRIAGHGRQIIFMNRCDHLLTDRT